MAEGPVRLTPDVRRDLTRRALLDAATHVFARRGFHAASLDEVAEAAGFSKGAIYSNFAGKEDLFFAVVEERDQQRLRELSEVVHEPPEELDVFLARIADRLARVVYRDRDWLLLELEVWLYAQRDAAAAERLATHQRATLARITAFVEDALAATGLSSSVPAGELAALMFAATWGIAQLQAADPDGGHERLYERLLALLAAGAVRP